MLTVLATFLLYLACVGFYQVNYQAASKLVSFDPVAISGVTGQPVKGNAFLEPAAVNRVLNAISPLHYGTYGGIALKFLYLVLGALTCAVAAALPVHRPETAALPADTAQPHAAPAE